MDSLLGIRAGLRARRVALEGHPPRGVVGSLSGASCSGAFSSPRKHEGRLYRVAESAFFEGLRTARKSLTPGWSCSAVVPRKGCGDVLAMIQATLPCDLAPPSIDPSHTHDTPRRPGDDLKQVARAFGRERGCDEGEGHGKWMRLKVMPRQVLCGLYGSDESLSR